MACFLDSSALVKYYVTEPGSAWVRQQVDEETLVVLAEITIAEVAAALGILQRQNYISAEHRQQFWDRFERDCVDRYDLIPVGLDVIYAAAFLCAKHPLKAYDAVQLAAALTLKRILTEQDIPLVFVSGDTTLVVAAQTEELTVDNPFWHISQDSS
jgi:predicted nucleic acid-binding protein